MERSNQRVASLADTSWSREKIIFLRGSDGIEYTTRILPQKNELFEGAYIRPHVYLGYGVMGLYHKDAPVNVSISACEWGAYLGDDGLKKGVRVKF